MDEHFVLISEIIISQKLYTHFKRFNYISKRILFSTKPNNNNNNNGTI